MMNKWLRLFDFNSYFTGAGAVAANIALGTAAVSAGAAVYGGVQQSEAADEQEALQNQARADAQAQEDRMFDQQALDAENTGNATAEFGVDDEEDTFGTYDDFLTPTAPSTTGLGGTKANSGLMI